jgi:biopolymer transport protein ExbD
MQFRRQQREAVQINLTPLIDVVFLLLIFFMVSTSFSRETQLQVDLPSASGEATEASEVVVDIGIGRHGELAINGRALASSDKARLRVALKQAAGDTMPSIIVSADAQSPHQAFVDVMDVAASLGFSRLAIAAQQEEY